MAALDTRKVAARRQLAAAGTRPAQARAAGRLEAAYAAAAEALRALEPGPVERPAVRAAQAAVADAAAAQGRLARAAAAGDRRR